MKLKIRKKRKSKRVYISVLYPQEKDRILNYKKCTSETP